MGRYYTWEKGEWLRLGDKIEIVYSNTWRIGRAIKTLTKIFYQGKDKIKLGDGLLIYKGDQEIVTPIQLYLGAGGYIVFGALTREMVSELLNNKVIVITWTHNNICGIEGCSQYRTVEKDVPYCLCTRRLSQ